MRGRVPIAPTEHGMTAMNDQPLAAQDPTTTPVTPAAASASAEQPAAPAPTPETVRTDTVVLEVPEWRSTMRVTAPVSDPA